MKKPIKKPMKGDLATSRVLSRRPSLLAYESAGRNDCQAIEAVISRMLFIILES